MPWWSAAVPWPSAKPIPCSKRRPGQDSEPAVHGTPSKTGAVGKIIWTQKPYRSSLLAGARLVVAQPTTGP